jgi:hypothetical protein
MANKIEMCACFNPATDNSAIKRVDDFTSMLPCPWMKQFLYLCGPQSEVEWALG